MKPTPYVYQTSSNPDWVYEDQTNPGGLIQRGNMTPSVGGQQSPRHVEWSHGGVSRDTDQYDPSVVTETPCIGGGGPSIGQQRPRCVEFQYNPPVVTETPGIGSVGP